jgi:subtilisin family serine protease
MKRRRLFGALAVFGGIAAILPSTTASALTDTEASAACAAYFGVAEGPEALSACQWDHRVMDVADAWDDATGDGVTVGIIDSGVDGTHPDLDDNFDLALSCSFITTGTPTADPSEIANGDCSNKGATHDLQGHGTHVASTVAGEVNGIGIAGVAPDATVASLKACTIQGFCFADAVAAALRYAGDQQLDVVNLSLFADPFLYYCKNDAEQRAILRDLTSAARYAQQRGVVVVASAGNEADDLGHPISDEISPDWPPDTAITREVRNNCRVAPAELPGVITVSAIGVTQLASYSNIGHPVEVTAPGGDAAQTPGNTFGRILAGWTSTDMTGSWEAFFAVGRGVESGGGRYVWISGTSMSSPHVAGVAALVKEGHPNWKSGSVSAAIRRSATPFACPSVWPADDERQCTGSPTQNSFYGAGIANADGAAAQ